jgi:hypothetical protein
MHGIQHLFRQHAVEKQSSIDSWHSAINQPYANGRSVNNGSATDVEKPPIWNQGKIKFIGKFNDKPTTSPLCSVTDRVLDQLHEPTLSSSPKPVPNSSNKSPSQEFSSQGSSFSSTNRFKRNSPDPYKMMGRSPNIHDANPKRILATTPSRRASNHIERVGSPSLSGYPVRAI